MFISVIVVTTVFVCLALFSCAGDRIYSLTPGAIVPILEDIIHKLVSRDLSRNGHNNTERTIRIIFPGMNTPIGVGGTVCPYMWRG